MRRSQCKAQALSDRASSAGLSGRIAGGLCVLLALGACGGPIITFQGQDAKAETATVAGEGPANLAEPTSTGSIDRRPITFGSELGAEDWRRAHAALAVALDPQGNGRPVKWDNPETSLRGSVNPTGLPYVANNLICRDFLASVIGPAKSRFLRGTGCKPSGGEWDLTKLRAAKP